MKLYHYWLVRGTKTDVMGFTHPDLVRVITVHAPDEQFMKQWADEKGYQTGGFTTHDGPTGFDSWPKRVRLELGIHNSIGPPAELKQYFQDRATLAAEAETLEFHGDLGDPVNVVYGYPPDSVGVIKRLGWERGIDMRGLNCPLSSQITHYTQCIGVSFGKRRLERSTITQSDAAHGGKRRWIAIPVIWGVPLWRQPGSDEKPSWQNPGRELVRIEWESHIEVALAINNRDDD